MNSAGATTSRLMWQLRLLGALLVLTMTAGILAAQPATETSDGPSAREILGPPRGVPLSGDALEAKAVHVASLLRCPVCQGLSIDDSPAPMARNMSLQVRDLLSQGYDQEQVLTYFESSYGEFVLLQPPLRGVNWLVWLAPVIALILGGVAVFLALRKMSRRSGAERPPTDPAASSVPLASDDPELERYLAAARGLAADDSTKKRPDSGSRTTN